MGHESPSDQDSASDSQLVKSSSSILEDIEEQRNKEFKKILDEENININLLKEKAWNGIPEQFRALTWKLLFVLLKFYLIGLFTT